MAAVQNLDASRFGYLKKADFARLADAYRFSEAAHAGQKRQSGDPYISHPLAVAEILAGWHLDGQALMAALLHDVMEDTSVTKAEISDTFGKPVADLVDGVSKLDKIEFQSAEDAQAENFRKMLLAMARDVRVIGGPTAVATRVNVHVELQPRDASLLDLNVIGCTVDEAITRTERFLDESLLGDSRSFRLIHGHGTGQLRRGVTSCLKQHPLVASIQSAPPEQGGGGVTVVELKD